MATIHGKRLVEQFESAVKEHAFKGAAHPGAHDAIEQDYQHSKQALLSYLGKKESE